MARPLRVTRKEIERSLREDLIGIRRLAAAGMANNTLVFLREGDWEPELSSVDVGELEEEDREDEEPEDSRGNLRPEVPFVDLCNHTAAVIADGLLLPVLLGRPYRRFDIMESRIRE
jgi:hypothetical protein